jgi:hypothetical protein
MSGSLTGTGHVDVPNAMPGLNFKFLSSYAKHKIPGWAPVYQALGIDSVLVTMIGMFTGEDGTDIPTKTNSAPVKGISSPAINNSKFDNFPHFTNAISKVTNSLDTYENLQSFINFGVQKQQSITIEINIAKNGVIRPTVKTTGAIRGSNGNPTFTGIIRSLDTYYRRFDRTYYILTLEVTEGLNNNCSTKPLNLTNRLDEVVKSQLAKLDNSCKVTVEDNSDAATKTPEQIAADNAQLDKDACYKYQTNGTVEKAFSLGAGGVVKTGVFEFSTNKTLIKTTAGPSYSGVAAINFLIDNSDVSSRTGCNSEIKDSEARLKYLLNSANITYKDSPGDINKLVINGEPFAVGELNFGNKGYAFTKEGYLVYVDTGLIFQSTKILSVIEANEAAKLLTEKPTLTSDFKAQLKRFLSNPNVIYTQK